jgi:hypothetical protein
LSRASIARAPQIDGMGSDTSSSVRPGIEVSCAHCGASGELFSIGAVWHRGAIETCSYFAAAAGPANLVACPRMMKALEALWRPNAA